MTVSLLPSDADARAAIRDDLDATLVVEAAAGTGKTTELVNRILRVLEAGLTTMEQIVAVTFTEKAAGELKLRLREALETARTKAGDPGGAGGNVVRDRLDAALERLEEAHVNTIHGFCAELIRERPVEAHVDPLFAVLTEPQAGQLYARAFQGWLQEALANPPDGVRRALRRTGAPIFQGAGDGDGPVDRLRRAGRALAEWRDFPEPWRRPAFDRAAAIAEVLDLLHRLAGLSEAPLFDRDNLYVDTDAVRRLSRQIKLEESFGQVDLDGWEARLVDLVRDRGVSRTRKGSGAKYGKHATRTEVLAARDALFAALQQFKRDADGDLAACLQQELAGATSRYQELKSAAGALDFADLLAKARDLIKSNETVRRHLQRAFTRIFVDEFQDTDPIQAEILLLLAGGQPGKLFIVGDPKQAIYRFRGTDVETYWRVRDQLGLQGGRTLQLTTSYRSVPSIQRFVNAAFERHMVENRQTLQAGYVPLAQDRDEDPSQPAIIALPVPKPYGRRSFGGLKASAKAIEESLPDAIGAFIAWLTENDRGWTVAERGADGVETRVPLEARHIAILFRRFTSFGDDVTRPYVDAIEARGIPHLLVGGKAFHGREEVEAVRAVLAAIEWPDDELSTFAALKGPLFAIDDEHLFEFKSRFHAFHPFRVPPELGGNSGQDLALTAEPTSHLMPIAEALAAAPAAAPGQELSSGRRHDRPVAGGDARARRPHPQAGGRAGARERPAHRRARAAVRGRRRHLVPRVHRRTAGGGGVRSRRGADSRGGQRRRPADDRSQGEGPRVPGRHPGGSHLPHEPRRRQPPSRSRARAVRDPPERMGAARAAGPRGRRGGAGRGRGHPARVRRRDEGARPAGGARPWRRALGWWAG